jgi:hypothetical protein
MMKLRIPVGIFATIFCLSVRAQNINLMARSSRAIRWN